MSLRLFLCFPTHATMQVLRIHADKPDIDAYTLADFEISGYNPHKKIAMKMAV